MQNLKNKLEESGHMQHDPSTQLSLVQYMNKMKRMGKTQPSPLEKMVDRVLKAVFKRRGAAHTNAEVEAAVAPIRKN